MFEQTFVNAHAETRKPWTVAFSLTLQVGFVATLLILPLLHPGTITPHFGLQAPLILTKLEPPPLPPEEHETIIRATRRIGVFISPTTPPRTVPTSIDMTPDPAPEIVTVSLAPASTGPLTAFSVPAPPQFAPPPTPKPQIAAPAQIRIGGTVQSALLTYSPRPAYPPIAKAARIQGTVHMAAVIGRDGAVRNLRVTGGPSLLIAAALQAVSQWRYQPTLLNGEPVEVLTDIDVNFVLN